MFFSFKMSKHFPASLARKSISVNAWLRVLALFSLVVGALYVAEARSFPKPKKDDDHFSNVRTGSRADWGYGNDLPNFCKKLIANPKPYDKNCRRDANTFQCTNETMSGEYQMFSQFHQDYFFYTRHFKHLNRPGVYLDIATNDPVSISNSFFMDRCLGWKGVCVEGNPGYHEKIYRMRSCQLVPTCVGSREGQSVQFGLKGGAGGIVGASFKHTDKFAELGVEVPTIRERCTMMKNVLERNGIRHVDYLSLDVEGHEFEVLKGMDWDQVVINVMSIEVSGKTLKQIEEFLTPKGYKRYMPDMDERAVRTGLLIEDAIFLHESVEFGNPQ